MSRRVDFVWSDELVGRVDAARGDVSRSRFVVRAVEAALVAEGLVDVSPLPPRGSVVPAADLMWDRQQRLNKNRK
jgi:hypothetical protein